MITALQRPRLFWRQAAPRLTPAETAPVLLTIPEVCAILRVSKYSVYQLIHSRRLKTVQIGRRRLVALSAVHAMLQAESETA
jgi:excisionase family DNA binding protein